MPIIFVSQFLQNTMEKEKPEGTHIKFLKDKKS